MSCSCYGDHCRKHEAEKENELTEEQNNKQEKLEKGLYIFSILIFVLTFVSIIPSYIKVILYGVTILLVGYEIIIEGIKNIFKLNFEEDTLMTIAIIAACILGEFREACFVILLFKLGEMIEERAIDKSNQNIKKIVDIKATNANLLKGDETEIVDVKQIKVGDYILIKPGESVPVDCKVISGNSHIDTSNITGESKPIYVEANKELLSGMINLDGSVRCVVAKTFEESTASQIVDLVYEAQNNKGKTEEFITKFSKIYTPIVIILAILITAIPLLLGLDFKTWIMRSLVFLVASCPCSIVISIPLALYTCLGKISKKGMLIKGTKHIEDLEENYTQTEVLQYIYQLEKNSSHPIANSIVKRIEELGLKENLENQEVTDYKEIAGCGICGKIDGKIVLFGNKKLLEQYSMIHKNVQTDKNYIVVEGETIGSISLKEKARDNIEHLTERLKQVGIQKTVILTGDNPQNAEKIAKELSVQEVYASLLPKQKLEKVQQLKKEGKTIFIGDGINFK